MFSIRQSSCKVSYSLLTHTHTHAHTHARTHAHTHTHTHTQWHIHTCTNTLFNAYPVLSLFSFLFLKKKAESTYLWLQVVCVHSTLLKEAKETLTLLSSKHSNQLLGMTQCAETADFRTRTLLMGPVQQYTLPSLLVSFQFSLVHFKMVY